MQLRRHLRLFTIFSQMAYPSPLKAARPSTDSLRSPTPGRLASVNLAARQFLAIAYFASLVTASDLAALTALYLLRESFKLLIFLKFLIVCHAQPHAYGFAVIPSGMDIPGFAARLIASADVAAWQVKRGGHPCLRSLRFARNRFRPRGADRAIVTPGWLIYFIQKVPFSFLKRWWVSGRRKNLFSFNQEKSFSASLSNFRYVILYHFFMYRLLK